MNIYVKLSLSIMMCIGSIKNAYAMNLSMINKYIEDKKNNPQIDLHKIDLLKNKSSAYSIAFSPDGKYLATGSNEGTIMIWDAKSGEIINDMRKHSARINSMIFSPDSKFLVSASREGRIIVWDAKKGTPVYSHDFGEEFTINSVAFSSNSNYYLFSAYQYKQRTSNSYICIGDMKSGKLTKSLSGHLNPSVIIEFSPEGKHLATISDDGTAFIRDAQSRKIIHHLKDETNFLAVSPAFSPNGELLAIVSQDFDNHGGLFPVIYDVKSGKKIDELGPCDVLCSNVKFSPDGKYLASGALHTINIWEIESGKKMIYDQIGNPYLSFDDCSINFLAYSPDGKYLACATHEAVYIYRIKKHENFMIDALKDEKNEKIEPIIEKYIDPKDKNSKLNINYQSDHKRKFDELDN